MNEQALHKVLICEKNQGTMDVELQVVRIELVELERRLIAALVTVQHALGKESSVMTRAERRKR